MILTYRIGDEPEQQRSTALPRITVGRAATCDVIVDREGVAPEHFHLFRLAGAWFVEDRQSPTGTVVIPADGTPPQLVLGRALALAPGDQVMIGHHTRPRFRAHFALPAVLTDAPTMNRMSSAATPATALATCETPAPVTAEATAVTTDATAACADMSPPEVLALQLEIASLHATQRDAARDRDAANREIATMTHALANLSRDLEECRAELTRVHEDLAREHQQHAALRERYQEVSATTYDANLLAQQRAQVIEAMSGDIAWYQARVAELEFLAHNLTIENERLHRPASKS